ncbi:hypothetical protein IF2G_06841 [Cordyceps javanica]|nr:hypothetical protein IF2G_06841 [Cordyceps javanica]
MFLSPVIGCSVLAISWPNWQRLAINHQSRCSRGNAPPSWFPLGRVLDDGQADSEAC